MVKIIIDNVYTRLLNVPTDIENKIWDVLSFEVKDFGSPYIQIRHLYNRKTKKTYTGLLDYIYEVLNDNNIKYTIDDQRTIPTQNANYKIQDFITTPDNKQIPLKARDYQQKIIDDASNREIIRAATGAGKTFIMAGLIAKFKVKPVSIFADKLSLCTQLRDEISKFLGESVGLVGGGINDKQDITVYSAQSTTEDDIKDSNLIMFDECFTEDTLITLNNNEQKTIKEIVDNKLKLKIPTYNIKKNKIEYKKIYNWGKKKNNKKLYKITILDENNKLHTLICTEDHKIFSNNKYIMANSLNVNDPVIIIK